MIFLLLINLKLLTIANYIAEHENFFANKYENAKYIVGIFKISKEIFVFSRVKHEKRVCNHGPGFDIIQSTPQKYSVRAEVTYSICVPSQTKPVSFDSISYNVLLIRTVSCFALCTKIAPSYV